MKKQLFIFSLGLLVLQLNAQDQTINGTTFKADGKVGVGTSSPLYKLDVNGKGRFTDKLNLQNGAELYAGKTINVSAHNEDYYIGGNSSNYNFEIGYGSVLGETQ